MLFKAYNLVFESDFDIKLNTEFFSNKIDCRIKKYSIFKPKTFVTKIYRKGIRANVAITQDSIILEWPKIAIFEVFKGEYIHYQRFTEDDGVFRMFLLSEVIGLVLFQRGMFLFHGGAIQVKESASIFVGRAGAGKSSTIATFAMNQMSVLSDDLTAIVFDIDSANTPFVVPSGLQLKIWEDTAESLNINAADLESAYEGHNKFLLPTSMQATRPVSLNKIFILQRPYSKKNNILEMSQIPIELLKYFPLPHQLLQKGNLQKYFNDSIKIANKVSVEYLKRPQNFEKLQKYVRQYLA